MLIAILNSLKRINQNNNKKKVWAQQISAIYDDINNSVQCPEYDSVYERLWIGHKKWSCHVSYVQGK